MSDKLFCPLPMVWNDIYTQLLKAKENGINTNIPKPPIPLILAAWWETSLLQKHTRWQETIEWAKQYGFSNLMRDLEEDELNYE